MDTQNKEVRLVNHTYFLKDIQKRITQPVLSIINRSNCKTQPYLSTGAVFCFFVLTSKSFLHHF